MHYLVIVTLLSDIFCPAWNGSAEIIPHPDMERLQTRGGVVSGDVAYDDVFM
jgi:hypothetical protein